MHRRNTFAGECRRLRQGTLATTGGTSSGRVRLPVRALLPVSPRLAPGRMAALLGYPPAHQGRGSSDRENSTNDHEHRTTPLSAGIAWTQDTRPFGLNATVPCNHTEPRTQHTPVRVYDEHGAYADKGDTLYCEMHGAIDCPCVIRLKAPPRRCWPHWKPSRQRSSVICGDWPSGSITADRLHVPHRPRRHRASSGDRCLAQNASAAVLPPLDDARERANRYADAA